MDESVKIACGLCDQQYASIHEVYRCRQEHLVGKPELLEPGKWTKPFGAWAPKQPVGGIDYV